AETREEPAPPVRAARPDLRAVQHPAAVDARSARADGSEVASRLGLAHPDRERQLAAADGGQGAPLLLLAAETVDHRARLAVCDPVIPDRSAPAQQLLADDEALHRAAVVAAIAKRQRHPEPA